MAAESVSQFPTWAAVILAVIGSGGASGLLTFFFLWRAQKSKLMAEATSSTAGATEVYSKAAITLLEPLERRLAAADAQIDRQAKLMAEQEERMAALNRELVKAHLDLADARNEIQKLNAEITTLRGR
jgi:uncharacterized protein (DUF3084 family)